VPIVIEEDIKIKDEKDLIKEIKFIRNLLNK